MFFLFTIIIKYFVGSFTVQDSVPYVMDPLPLTPENRSYIYREKKYMSIKVATQMPIYINLENTIKINVCLIQVLN